MGLRLGSIFGVLTSIVVGNTNFLPGFNWGAVGSLLFGDLFFPRGLGNTGLWGFILQEFPLRRLCTFFFCVRKILGPI